MNEHNPSYIHEAVELKDDMGCECKVCTVTLSSVVFLLFCFWGLSNPLGPLGEHRGMRNRGAPLCTWAELTNRLADKRDQQKVLLKILYFLTRHKDCKICGKETTRLRRCRCNSTVLPRLKMHSNRVSYLCQNPINSMCMTLGFQISRMAPPRGYLPLLPLSNKVSLIGISFQPS